MLNGADRKITAIGVNAALGINLHHAAAGRDRELLQTAASTCGDRDAILDLRVNKVQTLALAVVVVLGSVLPGFADVISDRVVANLKAQGFVVIQMDRTWLGRIWILAESKDVRREIVINPVTGEILRDYAVLRLVTAPYRSEAAFDSGAEKRGSSETVVQSDGAKEDSSVGTAEVENPDAAQEPRSLGSSIGGSPEHGGIVLDPVNPIAPQ